MARKAEWSTSVGHMRSALFLQRPPQPKRQTECRTRTGSCAYGVHDILRCGLPLIEKVDSPVQFTDCRPKRKYLFKRSDVLNPIAERGVSGKVADRCRECYCRWKLWLVLPMVRLCRPEDLWRNNRLHYSYDLPPSQICRLFVRPFQVHRRIVRPSDRIGASQKRQSNSEAILSPISPFAESLNPNANAEERTSRPVLSSAPPLLGPKSVELSCRKE
jgi:hypothetical protein